MAHFAELDENNVVLRVLVVNDSEILVDGVESEQKGIEFLSDILGLGGNWVQTSYNGSIRGRYAGVGYKYDTTLNCFIAPKPYPSWTLNEQTTEWEAPVSMPNDGKRYVWREDTLSWVEFTAFGAP